MGPVDSLKEIIIYNIKIEALDIPFWIMYISKNTINRNNDPINLKLKFRIKFDVKFSLITLGLGYT